MSHQQLCFYVILIYFTCVLSKFVFDTEKDVRCLTPNNKPGTCVSIHNCSILYNAFLKKRTNDEDVKIFLQESQCGNDYDPTGKFIPIVCCEQDAGDCETPKNDLGSCVPIRRCDPLLRYLESKPLLSGNVISYIQQSECNYENPSHTQKEKEQNRVCCPIIQRTKDIFSNEVISKAILTIKRPITQQLISDLNQLSTQRRVKLPEPGDSEGNCGVGEIDERILRFETDIYDHPWTALLRYGDGQWACSGSIITNKYILTAAQCVQGPIAIQHNNVSIIRVGELDTSQKKDCKIIFEFMYCSDDPIDIEPEEIITHHAFSLNPLKNDIALIRLKNTLPYNDYIRPLCLSLITKDPLNLKHLTVIGWKKIEDDRKKEFLSPLMYTDKEECKKLFVDRNRDVEDGQFCAIGRSDTWLPHNNTCTSVIGGPVIAYKNFDGIAVVSLQVGIVSVNSEECGEIDKPAVYTKVDDYMEWIYENLKP